MVKTKSKPKVEPERPSVSQIKMVERLQTPVEVNSDIEKMVTLNPVPNEELPTKPEEAPETQEEVKERVASEGFSDSDSEESSGNI